MRGVRGAWVAELPDVAFLRVHSGKAEGGDAIYSLVHNRAHTNVAFMFGEQKRLVPADDTLTVAPGLPMEVRWRRPAPVAGFGRHAATTAASFETTPDRTAESR
jgi:hypothetical protein